MAFSEEDKILIKSLYLKGYTANRLTDKFPKKSWTKRGVNKLFKKLWDAGTVDRWPGSGRPHSACTEENTETVNDLVLSQEESRRPTGLSVRYHGRRVFIGELKMQFVCIFFHIC